MKKKIVQDHTPTLLLVVRRKHFSEEANQLKVVEKFFAIVIFEISVACVRSIARKTGSVVETRMKIEEGKESS